MNQIGNTTNGLVKQNPYPSPEPHGISPTSPTALTARQGQQARGGGGPERPRAGAAGASGFLGRSLGASVLYGQAAGPWARNGQVLKKKPTLQQTRSWASSTGPPFPRTPGKGRGQGVDDGGCPAAEAPGVSGVGQSAVPTTGGPREGLDHCLSQPSPPGLLRLSGESGSRAGPPRPLPFILAGERQEGGSVP